MCVRNSATGILRNLNFYKNVSYCVLAWGSRTVRRTTVFRKTVVRTTARIYEKIGFKSFNPKSLCIFFNGLLINSSLEENLYTSHIQYDFTSYKPSGKYDHDLTTIQMNNSSRKSNKFKFLFALMVLEMIEF